MYTVVKTEPKGNRVKVVLNNEITFMLYKGEVRKLNITDGIEIDDNTFSYIMEILYKRARERALYILDDGYKTQKQIEDKLKSGLYPQTIIEQVIQYLKEYGLLDDKRYALLYIDYKSETKSKKQIVQDLYTKGINKNIIDSAFDESDFSNIMSLTKVIEKKLSRYDLENEKDKQRFYRYLLSKGYNFNEIKEVLSKFDI